MFLLPLLLACPIVPPPVETTSESPANPVPTTPTAAAGAPQAQAPGPPSDEAVPEAAPAQATGPDVFVTAADGTPVLARSEREGCAWEVLHREGDGWGTPIVVPGYPQAALSRAGSIALWVQCEGEQVDDLWVASSFAGIAPSAEPTNLGAQLPELIEAAWWRDRDTVIIQGRAPGDAISSVYAFTLGPDGVTAAPDPCVSLRAGAEEVTRDGQSVSLLLRTDLDDDDLDELVLEEPDSCGTGLCMATVWTRCPVEDRWRKLGDIFHRDGVTALPETVQGWKVLQTRRADQADRWHWNGQGYIQER